MSVLIRWVIVVVAALVVVGLIAFARGPDHQRGDDVGAVGLVFSAPVSATG